MITEFCKILKVSESDVLGTSRQWKTAIIRQLYWKLLRQNGFSLHETGRLCERHHSTIHLGVKHADNMIETSGEFREMWDKVKLIKR